jgi:hypothetical protein
MHDKAMRKRMMVVAVLAGVAVLAAWGVNRTIHADAAQQKQRSEPASAPTARVFVNDSMSEQDVADLHVREDLLLENYTWANAEHSKVRIPIERAMELVAERGIPVAANVDQPKAMTGDGTPHVTAPLTNGFARTAFEQGTR